MLSIELSVDAREMTEAYGHYTTHPRRWMPRQSYALRLHPSPIGIMERGSNERFTYVSLVVRPKPKRQRVTIKWFEFLVLHILQLTVPLRVDDSSVTVSAIGTIRPERPRRRASRGRTDKRQDGRTGQHRVIAPNSIRPIVPTRIE